MGNGVNWGDMWNSWGNFGFGGGFGGFGGVGGFGGMGSTWGDGFNMGAVGDSWGGSSSSSSSSKLTDEEKKAQALEKTKLNREIKSIRDLLNGLVKDENILSTAERDSLDYDLKHLPSKPQEKLDAIKVLYNQYKDTIKNNLGKIESLKKDFAGIGYESETDLDDSIPELASAISAGEASEVIEKVAISKDIEILDLLSSWNSNTSNGKHLMHTVLAKYDEVKSLSEDGKNQAKQCLENFAKTLKSKLSARAGELANNAMLKDETMKEQLKSLRNKLDSVDFTLCAEHFDELYKACRLAGAKIMENTYKDKYEFLGSDNLFGGIVAETEADLEAEGVGKTIDTEKVTELTAAQKVAKIELSKVSWPQDFGIGSSNSQYITKNSKLSSGDGGLRVWGGKNDKDDYNIAGAGISFGDLYSGDYNIELGTDAHEKYWNYIKDTRFAKLGEMVVAALSAGDDGLDKSKLEEAVKTVNARWANGLTNEVSKVGENQEYSDNDENGLGRQGCNTSSEREHENSTYRRLNKRINSAENKKHIFKATDEKGNDQDVYMINFKAYVDDILAEYKTLV
ncbi:MAG: hypothetical protein NC191_09950 [Muribaculaceae bacterium]|nr:hypothetical protein [Muribaculaceae bacterium]